MSYFTYNPDMADEPKEKSSFDKKLLGYVRTGGKTLILTLAGRNARWIILGVAVVSISWLLYGNVWQTLNQPVQLPLGVNPNNPELDAAALANINNARVSRSQYVFKSFAAYDPLFAPAPTVVPTVLP